MRLKLRLAISIIGGLLFAGAASSAGRATEPVSAHLQPSACFSMDSLAGSLASHHGRLAVTRRIGGSEAKLWAKAVARKTGAPFPADEVTTIEGRDIAPLIMLVFSDAGCARNIVMVRIVPDLTT